MTVTIVVVPRERYSATQQSLESIYANTSTPFELIYVDGGSPPDVRDYLAHASRQQGFTLLRTDYVLTPNEARNLALPRVTTDFIVFIDNDVTVSPGWLEALVRCADETGAWIVGPLYLIGPPGTDVVHMAAGVAHFEEQDGRRVFHEHHRFSKRRLGDVCSQLRREPCELVEFHCMGIRRDALERLGALDEQLMSANEHIDVCLLARQAGGAVYFEPESVVTYTPSPPLNPADRSFYLLRWSAEWNRTSLRHFARKWQVPHNAGSLVGERLWLRRHRRVAYPRLRRLDPLLQLLLTWTERRRRARATGRRLSPASPRW